MYYEVIGDKGGEFMEKELTKYFKKHTVCVTFLIILSFVILFFGEYYLYRNQMKLNKMISEGFMQLKEVNKPIIVSPTESLINKK